MAAFDYTFTFSDIGDQPSFVQVVNHRKEKLQGVLVSCGSRNAFKSIFPQVDIDRASDAFKLATIVYTCDWLARRSAGEARRIRVIAPALHPAILNSPQIRHQLKRVLHYFTGDEWRFEWYQQSEDFRPIAQTCMDFKPNLEVALWSGGLDSGAGFLKRFAANTAQNYLLVGTGANDCVFGTQRQVHAEASYLAKSRTELIQVPINLSDAAEFPKEPSQRSRGFVFLLIGSVCAYLRGQQILHVYENGVGAINLPYCSAEMGLDHARSVHPTSLWEMSKLVSELFEVRFEIQNPFLFETKAQMCEPLAMLRESRMHRDFIFKTSSCDSLHRQKDTPSQCGYCSSCLLRRQSLAVNDIPDETRYALFFKVQKKEDSYALRSMLHQVETLQGCLNSREPWIALSARFPELIEVMTPLVINQAGGKQVTIDRLVALFSRYCQEWELIAPRLQRGLFEYGTKAA